MRKRWIAAALVTAAAAAQAAKEEDLVKYREHLMESIGGHMNNAVAIVKGEVPYGDDLPLHARHLRELAPLVVPAFEARALSEKSHALPKIWEDWDEFTARARDFEEASAAFAAAVEGGDRARIARALGDLGDSCKACHDKFTEEH
ncbi:MAG: cytochrome c [Porticoccaceae bacterium]|nr:MAG: cytochrome c [Porticoccaceae bacterium]